MIRPTRRPSLLLLLPLLAAAVACGDATGPGPDPAVDLDALFLPANPAEIAAVEADWAARAPVADAVEAELTSQGLLAGRPATVRVFSHGVDGNRHYGAVVVPDGAAAGSLPVVVFAHPGDQGVDLDDVFLAAGILGEAVADFVFVVPSFRSEPLTVDGRRFDSGGTPSPWDRDVDDAMALLDVALGEVPEADPARVGVVGLSRGAGVALLMGVRDPRVDAVVEFSGPTDFFGPFARDVVEDALQGRLRPLPGLGVLDDRFIQPLGRGTLSPEAFRLELARRSAVLFAERLPALQVHHGVEDDIVPVGQAESLMEAVQGVGGRPPEDEFFLYQGGTHDPFTMLAGFQRAAGFLEAVLGGPS